jgi:ketosteroid isomerase-like protein
MLNYLKIFILLTAISINAQAQSKKEAQIAKLVIAINTAIINTDSITLRNLTSDELSYGHSAGLIQDQKAFIAGVMNGPTFFKSIEPYDQKITMAGKNAIVRHIVTAKAVNKGNPLDLKFGNIMVWQKKQGKWKLLARQGYKL